MPRRRIEISDLQRLPIARAAMEVPRQVASALTEQRKPEPGLAPLHRSRPHGGHTLVHRSPVLLARTAEETTTVCRRQADAPFPDCQVFIAAMTPWL